MPRPRNMALPDTEGAETRLDPRVERSRAAIIEAAQAAVLENGYRGLLRLSANSVWRGT